MFMFAKAVCATEFPRRSATSERSFEAFIKNDKLHLSYLKFSGQDLTSLST